METIISSLVYVAGKEIPIFGTFIDPDDILQVNDVDQLDK